MRTAVIIPAYNEADALPGVLAALEALLRSTFLTEVMSRHLVIDDLRQVHDCV